jgi:hypothetical protein
VYVSVPPSGISCNTILHRVRAWLSFEGGSVYGPVARFCAHGDESTSTNSEISQVAENCQLRQGIHCFH